MNSTPVAAIASFGILLYAGYLITGWSGDAGETERDAEEAICREIAADTLNGSETLATYMQTRCPARFLTYEQEAANDHVDSEEDITVSGDEAGDAP